MTDLERDILRLWDKAMSPELIAKYLMIKQERSRILSSVKRTMRRRNE